MKELGLEQAFAAHRERVDRIVADGDWSPYADEFTEDATYRRHGHAEVVGREGIRRWIVEQMSLFPGSAIARFEVLWHVVDASRSAVIYEVRSFLCDPGDGSVHSASSTTTLGYGGDGLWSWGVDVHNPRAFTTMLTAWSRAAERAGTLALPSPLPTWAPSHRQLP